LIKGTIPTLKFVHPDPLKSKTGVKVIFQDSFPDPHKAGANSNPPEDRALKTEQSVCELKNGNKES